MTITLHERLHEFLRASRAAFSDYKNRRNNGAKAPALLRCACLRNMFNLIAGSKDGACITNERDDRCNVYRI